MSKIGLKRQTNNKIELTNFKVKKPKSLKAKKPTNLKAKKLKSQKV
jgi:hypothetical protein